MQRTLVAILMAGVALPAYAADLSGTYVPPAGDQIYSPQPIAQQPKSMVEGHLDIGIGRSSFDEGGEDNWLFQGAGRANIDFGGANLEIETGGASLFDNGFSYSSIGAAAHLWGRFNNAALGVYGAANFPTTLSVYTAGVEGEAYLGAVTLGAAADYNWTDGGCCGQPQFWTARGWGDLYLTPDARVGAELRYLSNDDFGIDMWGATIDAEYRFSGTPLSVWAEGNYASLDADCCGNADIWSGLLGLRVFLDGNRTLHQHDMDVPWDGGVVEGHSLIENFYTAYFAP